MPSPTGQEEPLDHKLLARMTATERRHLDHLARQWKTSVNSALRELIAKSIQKHRYDEAVARAAAKKAAAAPRTAPPPPPRLGGLGFMPVFEEPAIDGQTSILDDDQ